MGFLHLFIVNKSGGLILHRPLGPKAPSIGTNEWLRIGSTFHSLHAIAAEAGPVRLNGNKNSYGADDGIEDIEGGVILKCLQTRTGIKFVLTAEPGTSDLDSVLREIYVLYSDCALVSSIRIFLNTSKSVSKSTYETSIDVTNCTNQNNMHDGINRKIHSMNWRCQ